jgi:hypothetical protein
MPTGTSAFLRVPTGTSAFPGGCRRGRRRSQEGADGDVGIPQESADGDVGVPGGIGGFVSDLAGFVIPWLRRAVMEGNRSKF